MLYDQDLDMEELESRLYSQVYHSSEGDNTPAVAPQTQPATYNRPRYFNANTRPHLFYTNDPSYVGSDKKFQGSFGSTETFHPRQSFSMSTQTSDLDPQVPMLSEADSVVFGHRFNFPVNNIYINFEPQKKRKKKKLKELAKKEAPKKTPSKKELRKLEKRREKKKAKTRKRVQKKKVSRIAKDQQRVLEMFKQQGKTDLLIKHGFMDDKKNLPSGCDKTEQDVIADDFTPSQGDNKLKSYSETEELGKETLKIDNEVKPHVINLVDSENNSDCEINETAIPEVVIVSEDEQEIKNEIIPPSSEESDDVVFVEPLMKETTGQDTESISSTIIKKLEADRVDLLGTPESTNDFLDNSFSSTQNSEEVSVKVCVDEESDSASEFDPPKVFKEKEFEGTGADSFSELNLDSFTNYIASKASGKKTVQCDSNSSSESDYEENKAKIVEKEKKIKYDSISEEEFVINEGADNLPTLSPIDSEEDEVCKSVEVAPCVVEKPARASTPTKPAQPVQAEREASTRLSKKARRRQNKKRKSDGNSDDQQTKKQKLRERDNFQTNPAAFKQPFEDVSETEFIPDSPEDSCIDLASIENLNNPAKKIEENTNKLMRFSDYWSDDMYRFYSESWDQENFSVEEEQKKMSDDPEMWKITNYDQIHIQLLSKGPRCHRCREFGHKFVNCTKVVSAPKCILCGISGHVETRCPNKLCTSCGSASQYFTTYCSGCARMRNRECRICSMPGHLAKNCPDLWRRYYLTTQEGPLIQPREHALKPPQDRWCSGCGSRGHFEPDCYYYNRSHPPSSPYIHSYVDIYPRTFRPSPGPSLQSTPTLDNEKSQSAPNSRAENKPSPGTSLQSTPNIDNQKSAKKNINPQKIVSHKFKLNGVSIGAVLHRQGRDSLQNAVSDFPGCKVTLNDESGQSTCTLEGPSAVVEQAGHALSALLCKHITNIKQSDLRRYFDGRKNCTPATLRSYFELLDSNKDWSKLARNTRKKALAYSAASQSLIKILPRAVRVDLKQTRDQLNMAVNSVILAKNNLLHSEDSLKILKEAAYGGQVDPEQLKRAYNHIFRNPSTDKIDYQRQTRILQFSGDLKNEADKQLSHGTELCTKHNLTEQLMTMRGLYVHMSCNFRSNTKRKFTKLYKTIVNEATKREAVEDKTDEVENTEES